MTFRSLLLGAALLSQTAVSAQSDLDRINQIRRLCADINATHWTDRKVAELGDSWIDAYYHQDELRKISVRTFNEADSGLEEFYLHEGALVYVYAEATRFASPADSTTLEATLAPLTDAVLVPQRVTLRAYFGDAGLLRLYTGTPPLTPGERALEAARLQTRYAAVREALLKS